MPKKIEWPKEIWPPKPPSRFHAVAADALTRARIARLVQKESLITNGYAKSATPTTATAAHEAHGRRGKTPSTAGARPCPVSARAKKPLWTKEHYCQVEGEDRRKAVSGQPESNQILDDAERQAGQQGTA